MSYEDFKAKVWEKKLIESLERAKLNPVIIENPAEPQLKKATKRDAYSIIDELSGIIADVNCVEIASQVDEATLWNWCNAWGKAAKDLLSELEKEVDALYEMLEDW